MQLLNSLESQNIFFLTIIFVILGALKLRQKLNEINTKIDVAKSKAVEMELRLNDNIKLSSSLIVKDINGFAQKLQIQTIAQTDQLHARMAEFETHIGQSVQEQTDNQKQYLSKCMETLGVQFFNINEKTNASFISQITDVISLSEAKLHLTVKTNTYVVQSILKNIHTSVKPEKNLLKSGNRPKNLTNYSDKKPALFIWTPELINTFWHNIRKTELNNKSFAKVAAPSIKTIVSTIFEKKSKICDYGGGDGYMSGVLNESNFQAFNYDPSMQQTVDLSIKSNWFDGVLCLEVIEHLDDEALFFCLNDIYKLLKPGGYLILSCPNQEALSENMVLNPETLKLFHRWQHVRSVSKNFITSELKKHGFKVEWYGEVYFSENDEFSNWFGNTFSLTKSEDTHDIKAHTHQSGNNVLLLARKPGAILPKVRRFLKGEYEKMLFGPMTLNGPYKKISKNSYTTELESLSSVSDQILVIDNERVNAPLSNLILYENGVELLSNHSKHSEIAQIGCGRYSHWKNELIFSASDNTNPNVNKRKYNIEFL